MSRRLQVPHNELWFASHFTVWGVDRVRASHVIPAAGIRAEAMLGRDGDRGIATAALQTAERVGVEADLVLVAVARGEGQILAEYLQDGRAVAWLHDRSRGVA